MGCEGPRWEWRRPLPGSEVRPGPPGICPPGGQQGRAPTLGGEHGGPGGASCFASKTPNWGRVLQARRPPATFISLETPLPSQTLDSTAL